MQDLIDFGTIGLGEWRDSYLALINPNPVAIFLSRWSTNLTGTGYLELVGVGEGDTEGDVVKRAGHFEGTVMFSLHGTV